MGKTTGQNVLTAGTILINKKNAKTGIQIRTLALIYMGKSTGQNVLTAPMMIITKITVRKGLLTISLPQIGKQDKLTGHKTHNRIWKSTTLFQFKKIVNTVITLIITKMSVTLKWPTKTQQIPQSHVFTVGKRIIIRMNVVAELKTINPAGMILESTGPK